MQIVCALCLIVAAGALLYFVMDVSFATDKTSQYTGTINGILSDMIDVVGTIFRAVGIILSVYAIGQLIMAFKNEDADSKSRSSTMLVVGIVLICLPALIKALGFKEMLTNGTGTGT